MGDLDTASMSQAQSQSAKAAASMDRGEKERKVNELVKFLLVMDQKKLPIKKQGKLKHSLFVVFFNDFFFTSVYTQKAHGTYCVLFSFT